MSRPLAWEEAITAYESHLRAQNFAARTLDGRRRELGYLRERLHSVELNEVQLTDLRDYQCALLTGEGTRTGRPMAAATLAKVTSVLRGFFGFLQAEGLLEENPAERLESPRVPQRPPGEVLTVKEARRLLAAPDVTKPTGLRDRALVELLWTTGIRRNECRSLDLSDVDHVQRELLVRFGKGGKVRVLPLVRPTYEALTAYLQTARPALCRNHPDSTFALFLSSRGRRLSNVTFWNIFRELRLQAGIKKRLTPHTLRRSFATSLLKNGASLRHIQALLGHANLNTTAIYLSLDSHELRRELVLRHPRERMDV